MCLIAKALQCFVASVDVFLVELSGKDLRHVVVTENCVFFPLIAQALYQYCEFTLSLC